MQNKEVLQWVVFSHLGSEAAVSSSGKSVRAWRAGRPGMKWVSEMWGAAQSAAWVVAHASRDPGTDSHPREDAAAHSHA